MPVEFKVLERGQESVLARVAPEVFNNPIDPTLVKRFLADPRHHIAVAIEKGVVIGFASGLDYIHPDKPREFWINEVGVSPAHRRKGVGSGVLRALLDHAWEIGCDTAWVLTDRYDEPARALYSSSGGRRAEGDPLAYEFKLR
jgi:GNAT superfamily N-acetyltransferase